MNIRKKVATSSDRSNGMPRIPNNRQELLEFFNQNLRNEADYYAGTEKSRFDVGRVKTFLIESNIDEPEERDHENKIFKFLETLSNNEGLEVNRTNDTSLFILTIPNTVPNAEGPILNRTFYIDARDERFWMIFTLAKKDVAYDFIFRKLLTSAEVDHAWFPSQLLRRILKKGQFRGYGGYFDNEPLLKNFTGAEREEKFNQTSMKLWGRHADEFLNIVQKSPLKDQFSFYNARIKYSLGGESVTEDWYYNGKIGTMGQSFNAHLGLVNDVFLGEYKNIIVDKIEKELAIDYKIQGAGVFISGEPILIRFNQEQNLNIDHFINSVFDGTRPFRLLGTIIKRGNDFVRINALDMHVDETLSFNIRPKEIEIYLPSRTCGNTIARFLTLFQRHFISTAEAVGQDGNALF